MTLSRDVKKSNFTLVSTPELTDRFDFIRNGQNQSILLSDLITGMGLSGEFIELGEVAAVPVLQIIAGINYIRNILGGAGISVSVSAQNGIQIEHAFTVDKTGVPICLSETTTPTLISLIAGSGISLTPSGDTLTIDYASSVVDTALMHHTGDTITISAATTPAIVGANWTVDINNRFTCTSGGRATFTGTTQMFDIDVSAALSAVSGSFEASIFLYINGVQQTGSRISRTLTAGEYEAVSIHWAAELDPTDYVEVYVQNDDSDIDILTDTMIMRIN